MRAPIELRQPVLVRESLGSRSDAAGGRHEPIPTPKIAFARNETLPGLEVRLQTRAFRPLDDADLTKAPRQLLRGLDMHDQWFGIRRKGLILGGKIETSPMHARFRCDRRFEIVAERRSERSLIAGRNADVIDSRRISIFVDRASSFAMVSRSVENALAARRTRCASSRRALASARFVLTFSSAASVSASILLISWRECLAAMGHIGNLLAVRRFRCQIPDLRVERRDLPRDLRNEILPLGERGFKAPKPGPDIGRAMRDIGEMCVRLNAARFGRFELDLLPDPLRRSPCHRPH